MAEVVTAVAWEEWEGIVMVTMVLLVICVWGTEPEEEPKQEHVHVRNNLCRALAQTQPQRVNKGFHHQVQIVKLGHSRSPGEVVDGTVLVARIGATVAAGVTVLKEMGFCKEM